MFGKPFIPFIATVSDFSKNMIKILNTRLFKGCLPRIIKQVKLYFHFILCYKIGLIFDIFCMTLNAVIWVPSTANVLQLLHLLNSSHFSGLPNYLIFEYVFSCQNFFVILFINEHISTLLEFDSSHC